MIPEKLPAMQNNGSAYSKSKGIKHNEQAHCQGKFYLLQTCRSFYKHMQNSLITTVYILELVEDM